MSDSVTCLIHGTCTKIEEGVGENAFTSFFIDVGSQYPVKLQTKKADIIAEARAVGNAMASWKYEFSLGGDNPHRPGTKFKNRYLSATRLGQVGTPTREPNLEGGGSTTAAASSGQQQLPITQEEEVDWDEKQRRDLSSRAWAQTISALSQTATESDDAFFSRCQHFQRKIYADVTGAWGQMRSPDYFPDALRPDPTVQSNPGNSNVGFDEGSVAAGEWDSETQPTAPHPDDDIPF